MGVEITDKDHVALFCNTTDQAFGPIFADEFEATSFVEWYTAVFPVDMRTSWFAGDSAIVLSRHRRWYEHTHQDGQFFQSVAEKMVKDRRTYEPQEVR